ncbi:MAG: sigma 54-interacting transcriptional regulator, partial [Bacteroidota bacterium]
KTGYTLEEATVLKAWEFSEEVKSEVEWQQFFETVKSKKHYQVETEQYRKLGGINYVDTISTYMNYEGKEYIFSIVVDVTQKKAREKQLEQLTAELKSERNYLQQEITSVHNFNEIITKNKGYKKILKQIQQVSSTDATVLILGETGTGKELVARAIHNLSKRRGKAMVKVNCAALPSNLIESELFGHEKGAFTGAYKQKVGRFELADKGTIFLDEIGEMPLDLQSKLLRALQEGEFERLGSTQTIKVDVRVIAATNRKLQAMVDKGEFREDLYYRLNVFPINNIPLRERRDDIPLLVNFFTERFSKKFGRSKMRVTEASLNRLMEYPFPGNIRELENLIERAIILSSRETLNLDAALPKVQTQSQGTDSEFLSLEDVQRRHIIAALNKMNWKVTGKSSAAELLKVNGKTLASKIKKLNITRE